ncbi:MAG: hypothetical protein LBM27_05935, partial [Lactobacillaceae bacterium]|nr:hypothetical protein [Lactobacillaceae bacterium]
IDPRGTSKLDILHGKIAKDLKHFLDKNALPGDHYKVYAKGFEDERFDHEFKVDGRYYPKNVDITVLDKNDTVIAGFELKFPMSSFNKNSNNQFENLLGNTANIRSSNHGMLYYLILITPDAVPLFQSAEFPENRIVKGMEKIGLKQLKKYAILSEDDSDVYFHTPNKSLIYFITLPKLSNLELGKTTAKEYSEAYQNGGIIINNDLNDKFKDGTILNDYENFIQRVVFQILGK